MRHAARFASVTFASICLASSALASEPAKPSASPKDSPSAKPAEAAKPADPNAGLDSTKLLESSTPTKVASGFKLCEGPLWWNDKLLFCDLRGSIMYTVDPASGEAPKEFRKPSEQAAGAALDAQGRLVVAHFSGKLTRTSADGRVETIAEKVGDAKLKYCNDVAIRSCGSIYFTDFAQAKKDKDSTGLYRLKPDGSGEQLSRSFRTANGVALSPDEKTLYVADYIPKLIRAYDVKDDGSVANERVFADLSKDPGKGLVDGLKCDEQGNVWTTAPGGVLVLSPKGERLAFLAIETGCTNLAFGGADRKTLFITAEGNVWSVRTKVAGAPGVADRAKK